ncbi:alcohol dehydrogenase catalytic domain-containing protein, partial [Mycobacterium tuberculosis]|nr:alcohol dehydrogenase catalytic domain-containing protein [Mycobacterium tuberculosis]
PDDNEVRIAIKTVGICGSDVHYYKHGRIGDFVVNEPMVLGHEAAGVVTAIGASVAHLKVGDRVCMEPGIPDFASRETLAGHYNLDPAVRFWATPPIHGCLTPEVVHPAALTYKLPDGVSLAEGAMVEPLAIGVYAAFKGEIRPGDIAVVAGAGTIGMMVAFAALASGCSEVIVSDVAKAKLDLIADRPGIVT